MEGCEEIVSNDGTTTIFMRDGEIVAKCVKTEDKEVWYDSQDRLHRDGDLAAYIHYDNGILRSRTWYRHGEPWREDGKDIREIYDNSGRLVDDPPVYPCLW
jgi:hypothetical protein